MMNIEMSKLTGNVDTYPCWDNKIHKELKLKNYATNVDSRLINLKMTKDANLDFNNRYFPIKSPGIPTIASLVAEKELTKKATEHKLINKEKIYAYAQSYIQKEGIPPNLSKTQFDLVVKDIENGLQGFFKDTYTKNKYSKNEIETVVKQTLKDLERGVINQSISDKIKNNIESYNFEIEEANKRATDEYKNNLLIEHENSMSALNNKRMREAEKEAKQKIDLDNLAQSEELEQKAAYIAPNGVRASNIEEEEQSEYSTQSSSASTHVQTSMAGTTITEEHIPSMSEKEFKQHIKNKTLEQTKNELFEIYKSRGSKPLKSGEYELYFSDTGKTVTFKPSNSNTKTPASKHVLETFLEDYTKPTKRNIQLHPNVNEELFSEFASAGIKIPKSKNAIVNRFNILRGEIESGNDNPKIISEIKHLSKKLYQMGLLNKHL